MKTLLALLSVVATGAALAQAPDQGKSAVKALEQNVDKVGAASLASPVSPPAGVEISAEKGQSVVTLKLSWQLSSSAGVESRTDEKGHVEKAGLARALSITLQTPVNKADPDTTLGTLDGLASGTTLELKLTNMHVRGLRPNARSLLDYCKRVLAQAMAAHGDDAKKASSKCYEPEVNAYLSDEELKAFRDIAIGDFLFYTWGLSAQGGYMDFTSYSPTTLDKGKTRKTLWSAGAFASMNPGDERSIVLGSYKYQQAYKDANSKTLCPLGSAGPITCVSGPIGEPVLKRTSLLTAEYRQAVTKNLAWSLSATRDFKNKISGVQLPIYLVSDGKGSLTGGIRFDWSSETHQTSVGLFIGQPFQLFE